MARAARSCAARAIRRRSATGLLVSATLLVALPELLFHPLALFVGHADTAKEHEDHADTPTGCPWPRPGAVMSAPVVGTKSSSWGLMGSWSR